MQYISAADPGELPCVASDLGPALNDWNAALASAITRVQENVGRFSDWSQPSPLAKIKIDVSSRVVLRRGVADATPARPDVGRNRCTACRCP